MCRLDCKTTLEQVSKLDGLQHLVFWPSYDYPYQSNTFGVEPFMQLAELTSLTYLSLNGMHQLTDEGRPSSGVCSLSRRPTNPWPAYKACQVCILAWRCDTASSPNAPHAEGNQQQLEAIRSLKRQCSPCRTCQPSVSWHLRAFACPVLVVLHAVSMSFTPS